MTDATSLPRPSAFRRRAKSGDRRRTGQLTVGLSALLLLAVCVLAVATGPSPIPLGDLARSLLGESDALSAREAIILHDIRLPRLLLGALTGMALGVSGTMMQGLFRNPLADPSLVGVSSGAAVAAVCAIVLGGGPLSAFAAVLGNSFLPVAAFMGALATTSLLYFLATKAGRTSIATLLLAGLAVTAIGNALIGLVVFTADDQQLRDITFWTLGSLGGATWGRAMAMVPFVGIMLAAVPFVSRGLDALILGEAEAMHVGINVETLKRATILAVASACGAAVAVAGVIGFIGIVVPHLLRLVMGPSNRYLLPASAFGGAALLIGADTICRIVVAPAELPIGIITALIGAPVFMALLLRRRNAFGL
ncbi:iron ABC transporter permease [Pleomorphomonas sp. JP5]|uniref:FecCD family ABC transporter permease n=1 Tax=Pleomorphomonas sp. JP5 TaxID=2942998 RepID=UPI0020440969|nr:iron ABC transporter permease [Pleomorphomonas sp. JP5]MCM5559193.1 iron ABC transporter permease [Pleomorphomonas sp. JP5]